MVTLFAQLASTLMIHCPSFCPGALDAGAGDGALCTDGRSGVGSGLAVRGEVGELKTGVSIGVRSLASGTRGVSALVVGDTAGVAGTALGFGR